MTPTTPDHGRRATDLPIGQLQAELGKTLVSVIPEDAAKNMPIGQTEAMAVEALKKAGWIPIPDVKCKVACRFVYPPGQVECVLECSIVF